MYRSTAFFDRLLDKNICSLSNRKNCNFHFNKKSKYNIKIYKIISNKINGIGGDNIIVAIMTIIQFWFKFGDLAFVYLF